MESRDFHALKEECSFDKDTLFSFRDRFQFLDETRIRLPYLDEIVCAFVLGEVCFYKAAFLSGLRFPIHPFIMELIHHLGLPLGNLCQTHGGSSLVVWR